MHFIDSFGFLRSQEKDVHGNFVEIGCNYCRIVITPVYDGIRGRPIDLFCRLICTDDGLIKLSVIGKKKFTLIFFPIVSVAERLRRVSCHYTVQEQPLEAR